MENQIAVTLSKRLTNGLENGNLKRDSLTNHGENYTGCCESIALRRYKNYIISGSYAIVCYLEKGEL